MNGGPRAEFSEVGPVTFLNRDRRDVFCYFVVMARLARIVAVNVAHHVTQRGNARQSILAADSERLVYLQLLRQYVELHGLSLLGYCLMSNHVHLVVVPRKAEALALALKQTHGRYASYWNAAHRSSGHVWQGRFYSCPSRISTSGSIPAPPTTAT